MSEQIKPCPFCGSQPTILTEENTACWYVECDCEAQGPHESTSEQAITAWNTRAAMQADAAPVAETRFYIDCEFDGHDGPLLSIALVKDNGSGIHIATTAEASDPWVLANVVPLIDQHDCKMAVRCLPDEVGAVLRTFIDCDNPTIVADSPVDIGLFCRALSTGPDGQWASTEYPAMRFEVHNVDCYPTKLEGAVQHNAWWDAMALKAKLAARVSTSNPVVDHETGNTSDKLRDAVEVWRDAYDAFTDFYHHTTEKDPARVIEADRQATRAALVAEIVAWLRGNCMSGKWRILASEIEAKWGKL